jgi:hypothetical protein
MTNKTQFAKLIEADIRTAWKHEAHDFTPWLLANLEGISEALGIPLESVGSEIAVESFSADILARNPSDDSLVLIENQLGSSDHKHLGQIMTYLAGLEAKVIIWIATGFSPAHLSALKWLNDHTDERFSFFAIAVKVVQIAASPFAPIFEVLERPNAWEKQLHAVSSGQRAELAQNRYAFWSAFVEKIPGELERGGEAKSASNRWHVLRELDLVISLMLAKNDIGIFVRALFRGSHEETRARLLAKEPELTSKLGVPLGDSDWHFFYDGVKGDYTDPSQVATLIEWIDKRARAYEQALREVFKPVA